MLVNTTLKQCKGLVLHNDALTFSLYSIIHNVVYVESPEIQSKKYQDPSDYIKYN